jgi:UrcA family protein
MAKFIAAALAASLSLVATAPASAEEFSIQVPYADLDLATPAGAKVLAQRVDATCERPDLRDISAVSAWLQCKNEVRNSAMEQLNSKGVAFDSAAFLAG